MSHDYILIRTCRQATCFNDLSEGAVDNERWFDEGAELLQANYPEIEWTQTTQQLFGQASNLGLGRLEITLSHDHGLTSVMINGSLRGDQVAFIKTMARTLNATAFDCQTSLVLD